MIDRGVLVYNGTRAFPASDKIRVVPASEILQQRQSGEDLATFEATLGPERAATSSHPDLHWKRRNSVYRFFGITWIH